MAQATERRPAIEVGPHDARILQFHRLATHDAKPGLAVGAQRLRMIERIGVEQKPSRTRRKGPLDGAIEQPRPDAPADVGQGEAEEYELAVAQLEIADELAAVGRNVDLVAGPGEQRGQRFVRHQPTLVPQPRQADPVVEVAIEGDGRRLLQLDGDVDARRGAASGPVGGRELQVGDRDRELAVRAWCRMVVSHRSRSACRRVRPIRSRNRRRWRLPGRR